MQLRNRNTMVRPDSDTTDMPMEWEDAECFEDLLALNAAYLRGDLPETPVNFGPLSAESALIIDELVALNAAGIFTTSSQPATQSTTRRQRGYVDGWWRGSLAAFVEKIRTVKLNYCAVGLGGRRMASDFSVDRDGRWHFSQTRNPSHADGCDCEHAWDTCTGHWPGRISDVLVYVDYFDTDEYWASEDRSLVVFTVSDGDFGGEPGACCKALLQALAR